MNAEDTKREMSGRSRAEGRTVAKQSIFFTEDGFSTAGMVLALLITLSLIFSAAQVYQVNSTSATIQNVADAGALAAENLVAEFYILVHVCDAIVLSLSLAAIIVIGLGLIALCVPATASLSEGLLKAGNDILKSRNSFAEKAAGGLNKIQKLLPFMSAVSAESVMRANSGGSMNASYRGIAILLPFEGQEISVGPLDKASEFSEAAADNKDRIKEAADKAEEAAKRAKEFKERAFQHDCGRAPAYCMYERAAHLSGISSGENPLYHSVETWSFSAALKRAQAYYPYRLAGEVPTEASPEGQADSALRKRFYAYATEELSRAYIHEDATGGFNAHFPLLPKNTAEMKETSMYTESVYLITHNVEKNPVMHAYDACPEAVAYAPAGTGSIAQMDAGGFVRCGACQFSVSSLGKVAQASSSIDNGFEYHYRIVAESARDYQQARQEYVPFAEEAKSLMEDLFSQATEALNEAISYRIKAYPPGRYGAIALVVNTQTGLASQNFESSFLANDLSLGAQAAISASTLVNEESEEGATLISSLLDGISVGVDGLGLPLAQSVLGLWSSLLQAYTQGQGALEEGLEHALDSIPLASESGLGTWAARGLSDLVSGLGLEPAELSAPKPVLLNTAHVLSVDESGFSQGLLAVKQRYLSLESSGSGSIFGTLVNEAEAHALSSLEGFDAEITIASLDIMGEGGPSLPITIVLPPAVTSGAQGVVSQVAQALRAAEPSISGVCVWE